MAASSTTAVVAVARLLPLRVKLGNMAPMRVGGNKRVQYRSNLINRRLVAVNNVLVAASHAENDHVKRSAWAILRLVAMADSTCAGSMVTAALFLYSSSNRYRVIIARPDL